MPILSRTNLCFFQSAKNLPSRRQELKTSTCRRISGYTPITSLRISFSNPSIRGAVFGFSPPPALFSSLRVKSSSRRSTQELRSCLWNRSTCGNKLRTMCIESPVCPCPRRGMEWSHAVTTFHLTSRTVSSNVRVDAAQPSSSMSLISSRCSRSLSLLTRYVFLTLMPLPVFTG